ncbi:AAA family ATPase [Staphylococcus lugdunensis]|uniref:AAA family ATPase n=1 Tax=Staphylococcus lugdunensis TaxID=28035 RepID=UPI0020960274|nr:AAA family ATPase [Staphylococcus lugdunensis]MCO6591648.1 AAA family ATPase [Staphylococcus lugdunensis]MCO6594101.1 AAA family ATPase [Staphylococcus lugdunensis]
MKKPILVGKGFRRISFEKLVLETPIPDDSTIVFESLGDQKHYFNQGMQFQNMRFKLRGNSLPEDTVIDSWFYIENCNAVIENLTIDNSQPNDHALNIHNSHVTINNVILKGKQAIALYIDQNSSVSINEVTVDTHAEEEISGIFVDNGSRAQINQSLMNGLTANQDAYIEVNHSLSTETVCAQQEGRINANDLYIDKTEETIDIMLFSHGQMYIDGLTIVSGSSEAYLEEGYLSLQHVNTENTNGFLVNIDNFSDAEGEGFEVINRDEYQRQLNDQGAYAQNVDDNIGQEDVDTQFDEFYEDDTVNESENDSYEDTMDAFDEEAMPEEKSALDAIHELIGLDGVKKAVEKFINISKINKIKQQKGLQPNMPAMHSLFIGNPGTGKTTVARLMAQALYEEQVIKENNFVEVSRQDLVSEYIGRTATQTLEVLESAKNGVLFIDEAYTLVSEGDKGFGQEAIDTILKYMEDHREEIMIIFAGYTNEMITFKNSNPGLASRRPHTFDFEDYKLPQLVQIGEADLINKGYVFDADHYQKALANEYRHNFDNSNGRWVRNFNEKLTSEQIQRISESGEYIDDEALMTITDEDFSMFSSQDDGSDETLHDLLEELHQLIGLANVKQHVDKIINEVKFNKLLEEQGKVTTHSNYHMIFTGAPGTGKTTVARLLAQIFKHLGLLSKGHLIETERSKLIGNYIGQTEKNTKQAVEQAMGGVLFIDEAYQLTPKGQSDNDFGSQAIETLITELENNRDKFIAIFSGYNDDMQRFLESNEGLKSRVPYQLHFEDYSPEEVADIVVMTLIKEDWQFDETLLREIVEELYANIEESQKSNGRWARNFVQELLVRHKNKVIQTATPDADLTTISNETILEMQEV